MVVDYVDRNTWLRAASPMRSRTKLAPDAISACIERPSSARTARARGACHRSRRLATAWMAAEASAKVPYLTTLAKTHPSSG
jgi:hypothetical protein